MPKGYILIRRNVPPQREIETLKTASSERKVDMSPELSAELKKLQVEKKKELFAAVKTFDTDGCEFPTEEGTTIHYTNFLHRVWHKVQDPAKVRRRTPHDLRYSWTSHMLSEGANRAFVCRRPNDRNLQIRLPIFCLFSSKQMQTYTIKRWRYLHEVGC